MGQLSDALVALDVNLSELIRACIDVSPPVLIERPALIKIIPTPERIGVAAALERLADAMSAGSLLPPDPGMASDAEAALVGGWEQLAAANKRNRKRSKR